MSVNFVIPDRDAKHLKDIIGEMAPEFFKSPEYCAEKDIVSNGILVAVFSRYLARMLMEGRESQLRDCLALLNRMAQSSDPSVVNYVQTEVFENLQLDEQMEAKLKPGLSTSALQLYLQSAQ